MANLQGVKEVERTLPREDAVLRQYAFWHPEHQHSAVERPCILCASCSGGCGNQIIPKAG